MRKILGLLLIVFSTQVFAEGDIASFKAEMTANLDKRIAALQEAKTCIASASKHEDLKKCHHELKEDRMEIKEDHMKNRSERMEKRLKNIHEKKAKGG